MSPRLLAHMSPISRTRGWCSNLLYLVHVELKPARKHNVSSFHCKLGSSCCLKIKDLLPHVYGGRKMGNSPITQVLKPACSIPLCKPVALDRYVTAYISAGVFIPASVQYIHLWEEGAPWILHACMLPFFLLPLA